MLSWPLRDSGDHGPGLCLVEPRPASRDALAPTPGTRGSQESPAAPVFLAGPSCADLGRDAPRTLRPPRGAVWFFKSSFSVLRLTEEGVPAGAGAVGLRDHLSRGPGALRACVHRRKLPAHRTVTGELSGGAGALRARGESGRLCMCVFLSPSHTHTHTALMPYPLPHTPYPTHTHPAPTRATSAPHVHTPHTSPIYVHTIPVTHIHHTHTMSLHTYALHTHTPHPHYMHTSHTHTHTSHTPYAHTIHRHTQPAPTRATSTHTHTHIVPHMPHPPHTHTPNIHAMSPPHTHTHSLPSFTLRTHTEHLLCARHGLSAGDAAKPCPCGAYRPAGLF